MPYKNPEDKRRWERDHRQKRNEQRKRRVASPPTGPTTRGNSSDATLDNQGTGGWKTILGLAIGFGLLLFGAEVGIRLPVRK